MNLTRLFVITQDDADTTSLQTDENGQTDASETSLDMWNRHDRSVGQGHWSTCDWVHGTVVLKEKYIFLLLDLRVSKSEYLLSHSLTLDLFLIPYLY